MATYERNNHFTVGVYTEPAGSYATDNSATPANFLEVPWRHGTLDIQPGQEVIDPQTSSPYADQLTESTLGNQSSSVSMGVTMHSHGTALGGNHTAPSSTTWALGRLLKAILGGETSPPTEASDSTVQSATSTTVTVDAGHGDRWTPGDVIGCEVVSGSGQIEVREVLSVSTDTVTVKQAFSATPVTSSTVYGGVTYYLTEDPDTSLQLLVEGLGTTDGAVFKGLQGSFSIQTTVGGDCVLTFQLSGAGWTRIGSIAGGMTANTGYTVVIGKPSILTFPVNGATTLISVCHSEATEEPQITYGRVMCGEATDSVARMLRQVSRPVMTGSFTLARDESASSVQGDYFYDEFAAKADHAYFRQLGNLPGGTVFISCPTVQITAPPVYAESGEGVRGETVQWAARHDGAIASPSTELQRSAFRISFL